MKLSSGREIWGEPAQFFLSWYDDQVLCGSNHEPENIFPPYERKLSSSERREIADMVIAAWNEWASKT